MNRLMTFKCKICKKKLSKKNFKCIMENVHKGFEKYNCDECAKISYKILELVSRRASRNNSHALLLINASCICRT